MGEEASTLQPTSVPVPKSAVKISRALPSKMEPRGTTTVSKWNTRHLGLRIASDFTSAACAGALVAPWITMIDRGIIENASGRRSLSDSLKSSLRQLVLRPHSLIFSRPFGLIFGLYTGTYFSANSIDTLTSTTRSQPASTVTAGPSKFLVTSATNLSLCLYKDSRFTQLFGALKQNPRSVPAPTYALFTLRDCLTIFASFNVPPLLAPRISKHFGSALEQCISSASAAQFIAPAAVQLFSTPLHLLGLDLYNREKVAWQERLQKVRSEWLKSTIARMGRIIPAFGIGGVVNMQVRKGMMKRLE